MSEGAATGRVGDTKGENIGRMGGRNQSNRGGRPWEASESPHGAYYYCWKCLMYTEMSVKASITTYTLGYCGHIWLVI